MKYRLLLATLLSAGLLATGCSSDETPEMGEDPAVEEGVDEEEEETEEEVDIVTSASRVTDEDSLLGAMAADGSWIVILEGDVTTDEELALEGAHENGGTVERKIALYAQDENRVKTDSYTLTAPRLTIESDNARIVGGTFVGDIYVEAENFSLDETKVEGNIYFASEEIRESFEMSEDSEVTGELAVQ